MAVKRKVCLVRELLNAMNKREHTSHTTTVLCRWDLHSVRQL